MTLLYMYFENGNTTYKGIKPNPKGYTFDNRFIVELDKENKIFNILDNPNYVQIYNSAISNVSCIVGRNGSGKTTFFELLITNIAWGITERQPSMMKSIYYKIKDDRSYEFFLHQYINWDSSYEINYNGNVISYSRNGYTPSPHPQYGSSFSSQIPDDTKIIFHSLSPFDKIFYSISLPFKKYPKRISPFVEQMKYIGNQNIFVGDPKHEIQTLTNLITLFSNRYFAEPFEQTLNYKFSNLEVDVEHKKRTVDVNTKIYIDVIIEKVNNFGNVENYPELVLFKELDPTTKEEFLNAFFASDLTKETTNKYLRFIIIDNFDISKIATNIIYFNNFLKLLSFSEIIENNNVEYSLISEKLLAIDTFPNYIFIKNSTFLNDIILKKEQIEIILNLSTLSIDEISEIKNMSEIIKLIRKLKNKDYLEFRLYLDKNAEQINYFYLSSGEKTMISYFANLMSSILEFPIHSNKTFIILIDEVELHLHPEWQRNFIYYMNQFFREQNLNMKYQFIIATHSPFILSDIVEEQIVFINQDEKKTNEHNTFGANIYDIFEKGFFLENSIGKCSENYIHELSNTLYLFKALEHIVKHQDYFLIRNYLQKYYEIDSNSQQSIDEQKKEADVILFGNILNELKNKELVLLKNKISITSIEKYVVVDTSIKLYEQINKYINVIGEPTIKTHLQEIYEDIKEFEIDAN